MLLLHEDALAEMMKSELMQHVELGFQISSLNSDGQGTSIIACCNTCWSSSTPVTWVFPTWLQNLNALIRPGLEINQNFLLSQCTLNNLCLEVELKKKQREEAAQVLIEPIFLYVFLWSAPRPKANNGVMASTATSCPCTANWKYHQEDVIVLEIPRLSITELARKIYQFLWLIQTPRNLIKDGCQFSVIAVKKIILLS